MSMVPILLKLLEKFGDAVECRFDMNALPDYLEEMKDDLEYYPTYFTIVEENGGQVYLIVNINKIREKRDNMFKLAALCR